ncbi:MAG: NAD(P)-binding protein [Candidatus Glassbacteria bacterium]|nr:NAD(P)-binding protein [Candidatus Glassbacteria bacterium]
MNDGEAWDVVILGAGLAGLTAGNLLSGPGADVLVIERERAVGGLSRTMEHNGFRFDLGGHRFITDNQRVDDLVKDILDGDFLEVDRSSKVLLNGKYFDYPWRLLNAFRGLGVRGTSAILFDYSAERLRRLFRKTEIRSFEDVMVHRFGRAMFDIFIKEYSEKVWGIECGLIAKELAEWRIQGLSLWVAARDALYGPGGGNVRTLARKFLFPPLGIGMIAEGLRREIERNNPVLTDTTVVRVDHSTGKIDSVTVRKGNETRLHRAAEFVSSIPLNTLVRLLDPKPPAEILEAAAGLRFRDLLMVTVMIDRPRVTDLTWIYVPGRQIPFGRIHEPTNWSAKMAPEGKTLLVTEHFCFRGDGLWRTADDALVETTVASLEGLGFILRHEVIDSLVLRIPNAYPVFEVSHHENRRKIRDYLETFGNLRVIGRGGTFRYFNMDHAIESGISAAEEIIAGNPELRSHGCDESALAEARP